MVLSLEYPRPDSIRQRRASIEVEMSMEIATQKSGNCLYRTDLWFNYYSLNGSENNPGFFLVKYLGKPRAIGVTKGKI